MNSRFSDRASFAEALRTAARQLDAVVRDGPGEAWTVSGGTPACGNPNASLWKAVATLAGDAVAFAPVPVSLPWSRRRAGEIAAFRSRQLEDLVRNPRPAEPHERAPFSPGSSFAERAGSYAWLVAGGLLAMAFALAAATIASVPLIDLEISKLFQRADVLARLGADPLPRPAELDGLGWMGRLGAALLLAAPVAFFLGGLHAAVNAAGERFLGIARFAPWCLAFIGSSSLLAFLPRMNPAFAVAGALLITAGAFLGTSLAWGRRRDIVWTTPRPRRGFRFDLLAAAVVAVGVLAVVIPTPTSNDNRIQETSRFRDRFLLGSAAGRALTHFYYAYTLYAAEPVQPVYSSDPDVTDRQVRTALLIGQFGLEADYVRALGFHVERAMDVEVAIPLIAKRQHDVYVVANSMSLPYPRLKEHGLLHRTIRQGEAPVSGGEAILAVPAPATQEDLQKALDKVLRLGGLESMLLELTWLGWTAVFYAGPLFVLLLVSVPVAAALAWLTRTLSTRGVRGVIAGLFIASTAALIAIFVMRSDAIGRVTALRSLPADDQKAIDLLAAGLKDKDSEVRYEAAYQACQKLKQASFPRGGLTAELRQGVGDDSVRVRLWCASALGLTRDPSVRADIFKALDDPDMLVRYRAAEGLEYLDERRAPVPPETVARLRKMIQTGSWYEGMYALNALRKIEPLKH